MDANEYLLDFYAQNGLKIRKMVDKILRNFGWITDKDHFYSLANEIIVTEVLPNYCQGKGDFIGWTYSCLQKKLLTEITAMNRQKRMPYQRDGNGQIVIDNEGKPIMITVVSIDAPIGDEEDNLTIGDTLESNFSVETEIFGEEKISDIKIQKYLNRLSKKQQKIVKLLSQEYKPNEIKEILHITSQEYADCMMDIKAYKNISILL